uniref:Matrin 3-like 1.1 n=1 Tax=Cyclopterus lumpus TaxID=8103 RepID=A0A8C3A2F0_CYCLU
MSQKSQSDGGQKHFAVGRGLLAAAETLNFSMNEQRSGRQMGGAASGVGVGGGGGGSGMDNQDGGSQMSRRGGGGHIGNTMKLFASLGLSPSDLDALAEIPEEDISVETLPRILMQLKSRKGDAGERRGASSVSSDAGYRGGRDSWDNAHMGRMGGPSLGTGSARGQTSADFGYSSLQDGAPSQGYGLNYGGGGGGSSRERPYSELSHHDSYGGGLSIGPPASDPGFRQRRIGSPSNGKVQDFLGVTPPMFPHVCSLCDFDVHSTMVSTHQTYIQRNLQDASERPVHNDRLCSSGSLLDTPNMSAGLLGPAPMSSSHTGGGTSRVVVVKYDRKPLSNKTLFSFTEPFGRLTEHLVLKNKAFLEMSSHEEAVDMVNYYEQQQASLYGKPLSFYLSRRLMVIEVPRPTKDERATESQVVFFSNLPREEERKKELLTIAGRFGIVEKHLFLTDQAFVQLGTPEDAEMLVKYYSVNSLTIKGRPIRLNICTKYKTLTQKSSGANASSGFGTRTSFNPARTSSSKSSSRTREEQEKEEELKPEEQPPAEEEEEEVSGVMEGEEVEEQVTDGDAEGEEPEGAAEETTDLLLLLLLPLLPPLQGMRVVNIVGFRRGYNFINELQGLAKPFGKVVKHLVLDLRPEAYLQFATEEEAKAMASFYNSNITASVCGRPVRVSHSISYPTIQCGSSKVVYVGQIPNTKYSDDAVLKLAEPFGRVKKYFLNRLKRECFIEMERAEEAEKMAEGYKADPPRFSGKRLTVYVSRKYRQLKHGRILKAEEVQIGDEFNEPVCAPPSCRRRSRRRRRWTHRPIRTDVPRPPRVEHVKMGFYCRVCFLFYSNEETAKKTHCSSQTHHDKLQCLKQEHVSRRTNLN